MIFKLLLPLISQVHHRIKLILLLLLLVLSPLLLYFQVTPKLLELLQHPLSFKHNIQNIISYKTELPLLPIKRWRAEVIGIRRNVWVGAEIDWLGTLDCVRPERSYPIRVHSYPFIPSLTPSIVMYIYLTFTHIYYLSFQLTNKLSYLTLPISL